MNSFQDFIHKLLTPKELKTLKKRFTIIQLLRSNLTYREIAQKIGISTTTVVRLNKRLKIKKSKTKNVTKWYGDRHTKMLRLRETKRRLPWKIG